ncbi:MAG: branched-chain amino acid ABC transporter permease [Acetobacteraceae bacterium]
MSELAASLAPPRPRMGRIALAAVAAVIVLAVLPKFLTSYQTLLLIYGLDMAIATLGFNLLLGYTGLLSFGHSAFFGAGAYTVALLVQYLEIRSMEVYLLVGILASAFTAVVFGFLCVRHTRFYFAILTLALSQVLWSLALKLFWLTGGTDGMRVPVPRLLGGLIGGGGFSRFIASYYYYVLVVFIAVVAFMWVVVHSPFGKALQAIRDNETRAQFLGLSIHRYRYAAFLISGTVTGLAGVLWVPLNALATPDILYWPFSGEIVFATLLGGFRTFTGPIIGGIFYTFLKTYAVAETQYWQFLLGVVLVVLILLLPTGIVGGIGSAIHRWRGERR